LQLNHFVIDSRLPVASIGKAAAPVSVVIQGVLGFNSKRRF
jgi:hypothetical protein